MCAICSTLVYVYSLSIILQPFFAQGNTSNDRQLMSKGKLINLWINKSKQAIKVIKSDGYWPSKNHIEIPVEENEKYYKRLNKYVICDDLIPDKDRLNNINDGEVVYHFPYAEVEIALKKCPNRKAPGIDMRYVDNLDNQPCFSKS